jgi:excisionase family DNA binding protein
MAEPDPWVAVEEFVEHLGVAKDSVYRGIEKKRLPANRIGRLWKFKLTKSPSGVVPVARRGMTSRRVEKGGTYE